MQLELYQFEGCPYCSKVRKKMSELGLSYVSHTPREGSEIKNQERYDELMDLGGQDQVPFLVARDEAGDVVETMYESDDINDWLDNEFGD